MKAWRCIALIFALVSVAGSMQDAWAAHAGGLPELATPVQALHAVVATLQTAVAALQSANATLKGALDAETAARAAADAALQTAVSRETSGRVAADAVLQTGLSAEIANRVDGDQHLEADTQEGRCAPNTASDPFGNVLATGDIAVLDLEGSSGVQIPLVGTASFAQPAKIAVRCAGFNWLAMNATIEALTVGDLH